MDGEGNGDHSFNGSVDSVTLSDSPYPAPIEFASLHTQFDTLFQPQKKQAFPPCYPTHSTSAAMPPVTALSRSSSTSTSASSSRTMPKPPRRARKAFAYRSPSSSSSSADGAAPSQGKRYSPYPAPPEPTFLFALLDSSTPLESEYFLAGSNTRYPGAPGTALWKAREAAAKAQQAAQREADKKRRAKEELARLGVDERLGAKRSRDSASKRSESPYVSNGASNAKTTPRRRGAKGPVAAVKEGSARTSTSRASSVARSSTAQELTSLLAVPPTTAANGTTTSNGRVRKPASRSNSPVPLTAAPATTRRVADAPRIPLGTCRTQAQFNRKDGQNMPTSQLGASSFLARSPEPQGAMP